MAFQIDEMLVSTVNPIIRGGPHVLLLLIFVEKMKGVRLTKILDPFGSMLIELLFHWLSFAVNLSNFALISAVYVKNFSESTATLIRHSQQFQFQTWCKMDFTYYPFDTQVI